MNKKVLAIFAHPDDAELMCTGTLSLLKKKGCEIYLATMTPGDKGSAEHTREEISVIRKEEARRSAQLIGGTYHCLEMEDVYILYDKKSINTATALIRKIQPDIVFTASPQDYMVDHEMTSKIVRTACFACGVKNMEVGEKPFEQVPWLYYTDAMEGTDILGAPVVPSVIVDITGEMPLKEKMLACHESQRDWLLKHHKMDEYILAMKRFAEIRGKEINTRYAEGFRQHLGHSYPQNNILKEILGDKVIVKETC
jgi:LmbE family N-acetylglucosaminyl deacetylase